MKQISPENLATILRHFRSSGRDLASGVTEMSGFILIQHQNRVYLTRDTNFLLMAVYGDDSAEMVFSQFIKGSIKDLEKFSIIV